MLFSQYLIDKNLLTVEQVLAVMLTQISTIPSIAEIMAELDLIPKKDLLQIIQQQQILGKDFLSTAYGLGFMQPEILEKIQQKVASKQRTFIEVAVEKGFLSLEKLSNEAINYSEYLTTQFSNKIHSFDEKIIKEQKVIVVEEKNSSLQIPSSLANKPMLDEYLVCFEKSVQPCLNKYAEKYIDNLIPLDKNIEEIKKIQAEYVTAKAAASFINAKISESITTDCAKYLENIIINKVLFDRDKIINLINTSNEILTLLYLSLKKEGREVDSENLLKTKIITLYEIIGQIL